MSFLYPTPEKPQNLGPLTMFEFEIIVDTPPIAQISTQNRINFVSSCHAQKSSGKVRIPGEYYRGYRITEGGQHVIRALLNEDWLNQSRQEVIRQAAVSRLLTLATQILV